MLRKFIGNSNADHHTQMNFWYQFKNKFKMRTVAILWCGNIQIIRESILIKFFSRAQTLDKTSMLIYQKMISLGIPSLLIFDYDRDYKQRGKNACVIISLAKQLQKKNTFDSSFVITLTQLINVLWWVANSTTR